MSFLDDLNEWWNGIWDTAAGWLAQIESATNDALNIKQIALDEVDAVVTELQDALDGLSDFENRVKTLRGRVIRADVAFKFVEEIRSGIIKKELNTTITDLRGVIGNGFSEVVAVGQSLGAIQNNGASGFIGHLIGWIQSIAKGYAIVAALAHALHQLVPIVQRVTDKMKEFEDIVLPQDAPRHARKVKGVTRSH